MNLTTRTTYALEIMLMAMKTEGRTRTQDIAVALGVGIEYPQQLVFKLKKSGLLTVKKGAKIGGSYANERTFTATIGDVVDALEDKNRRNALNGSSNEVKLAITKANEAVRGIKLVDLLNRRLV